MLYVYVSMHQPNLAGVVRHLIQQNPLLEIKDLAQNEKVLLSDKVGRRLGQLVDQRHPLTPQLTVPHQPPESIYLHSDLKHQTRISS